jgi:hypothetical protein
MLASGSELILKINLQLVRKLGHPWAWLLPQTGSFSAILWHSQGFSPNLSTMLLGPVSHQIHEQINFIIKYPAWGILLQQHKMDE